MKFYGREGTSIFYGGRKQDDLDVRVSTAKPNHLDILQDGEWVRGPEQDAHEAEVLRKQEIEEAQASSGLRNITVEQANTFIDNQLDDATTILGLRSATKRVLKKMVPFLINGGN